MYLGFAVICFLIGHEGWGFFFLFFWFLEEA